jgi:hypothetical protein
VSARAADLPRPTAKASARRGPGACPSLVGLSMERTRLIRLGFALVGATVIAAACVPSPLRPSGTERAASQLAAPNNEPKWQNLASWRGTGDRTTQSFRVTGQQWRLSYAVLPPRRSDRPTCISVRRPPIEEVASGCLDGEGVETVPAGPGEYYIFVVTVSGWTLAVDQLAS